MADTKGDHTGRIGTECLGCRAGSPQPVLPYALSASSDAAVFADRRIALCPTCGLHQIVPVPSAEELDEYYRGTYRSGERGRVTDAGQFPYDSAWFLSRGRAVRAMLEEVPPGWPLPHGAAVLDIGAGFGHVLFALGETQPGASLFATEPDPACEPFLGQVGARLLPASPDGLPTERPERLFDVVVMTHVLEHLPDPTHSLIEISALLARDGRLVLEVPNCLPRFAARWETAPHLSFFDSESLETCISRAGGRVRRMAVCGPPYSQRSWRDLVPSPLRRVARALIPRSTASDEEPEDWADPSVLPKPVFVEEGPGRFWLRAVVSFD